MSAAADTSSRRLRLATLALALAACRPELEVALASPRETAGALTFSVTERDAPRPRYHTVRLLDARDRTIWQLRAEPFGTGASPSRLRFGVVPRGFVAVVPAAPLGAGSYALVVTGAARGQLRFAVEADGRVVPSGQARVQASADPALSEASSLEVSGSSRSSPASARSAR